MIKIIFSTIMSFIGCYCYSQTSGLADFKCIYELKYKIDSLDLNRQRTDEMALLINNDYSSFYSYKNFYVDSLRKADPAEYSSQVVNNGGVRSVIPARTMLSKTLNDYSIVINRHSSHLTYMGSVFSDKYKYEEILNKIAWAINSSDTLSVLGYNCQKATTNYKGRKWTAWFTPQIPIGEGPWLLRGLPGLILKAEDENQQYIFNCIGFHRVKDKEPIEKKEENIYQKISKNDYFKLRKKLFEDIGAITKELYNLTPIFEQNKPKKKYNPIEVL